MSPCVSCEEVGAEPLAYSPRRARADQHSPRRIGSRSCCPTTGRRYVRAVTTRRPDRRQGTGHSAGRRDRSRRTLRLVPTPRRCPEHHPTPTDRLEDGVRRAIINQQLLSEVQKLREVITDMGETQQ